MTIARHRIERLIGGGAMGRVFVCRTPDDHVVAVKLLRTSHAALGDRLLDKRGVLEKVRSPHVVEVYDVSVYNNVPYLVMELCEGSTLAALLKSGPLRTADALAYAAAIADGARAAWAHGVAHGDLRPSNVLIVNGNVKLADFLLAPAIEGLPSVRGTPLYLAPELLHGTPPDALSDIYSFGVILAECLTGRTPYAGSPTSVLQQQSSAAPISFASLMPGAPHFLVELLDRLLEKDRARRMKTWDDVLEGVERAAKGLSQKEHKLQLPEVDIDIDTSFDDEHRTAEVHISAPAKDLMDSIDDEPPASTDAALLDEPQARAGPAPPAAAAPSGVALAASQPTAPTRAPVTAPAPVPMSIEELELPAPPPEQHGPVGSVSADEHDDEALERERTRVQPGISAAADALDDLLGGGTRPKPSKR
ncbi:MAG: protein kinase [Deltaproteobacteria bacterium]|nr:protein kinase [Deltaproteobacteria bacterium]